MIVGRDQMNPGYRAFFLRALMALFATFLLLSAIGRWPRIMAASPTANAPANLQCEAMTDPLGIDILRPRLSWQLQDSRRGARQTAYEARVASSPERLEAKPDIWDSGRVASDQSVNIPYGGPALQSRRRYYWQVRVWDQDGQPSPYSAAAWWEMGLLSPADWKAKWVSRDMPLERGDYQSQPKWIWAADEHALSNATPGNHAFRFDFKLPQAPKGAVLFITAKDDVAAWINGSKVLDISPMGKFGRRVDPWGQFRQVDVGKSLQAGANSLAAEVVVDRPERGRAPQGGLIALLRVQMSDGRVQRFISDQNWGTASAPGDEAWTTKDYSDSTWPKAAVIAEIGQEPLGDPWPAEPVDLLRRAFRISKPVRRARIYSTALGSYQLYLNGQRVGHDVLAPGWTDYRKRVVYQTYDVTSQLHQGENALGAILDGGWYADGLGWLQNRYNFGPPPVRLLAQLEIDYADGSHDTVVSDPSWKAAPSPILSSEIYNGETYDARREHKGWNEPAFSGSHWAGVAVDAAPPARLVAQDYPPIRVEKILTPKSMSTPSPGVYVFDLGQNMVGWARLHVSGQRGDKVRLRFGEVLQPNGELYTANLRTARATDTYILRGGGNEVFEPHFTFHGFRYIELTGYPGKPPLDAVQGVVFHTDAPFTIQFKTASSVVNQLWSNILWGQRGNFLSVPTDCPQRDERLGWMGDAEVFWRTASFNANLEAFSHKFTADIRDAQSPAGAFADVSPRVGPTSESAPGWADAGVIIPWTTYLQYADKRILQENWEAMEKWMDHIAAANPNHLWLKDRGNDYGDWLAIGSTTSKDLIATAFWAYDATLMTHMAQALDKPADAAKYSQLFDAVRAAFNQAYVHSDGTISTGSQTSYVLALHMDLLSPSERVTAADKLVADIQAHNWHLTTGFLGTPYLLLELSNSGHSDIAYRLLLQASYPSWGYMIQNGATTMWERWNGNQMLGDPSMNSFNHYAYGSVAEWLYRYAAGIDEDYRHPGFQRIILHPQFNATLGHVQVTYDSHYGPISSAWTANANRTTWHVSVPPNTTALLYFPAKATKIQEGGADISKSSGISYQRTEGTSKVYEVPAGSYKFNFEY